MTTSIPLSFPPGYPAAFEEHATLRDGRSVFIRPVVPSDQAELAFEIEHADPETLYHRFFRTSMEVDEQLLTHLTVLDYRRRFALAAFADAGVAIARYEATARPGEAEIAVAVKPDWRQLGLGTLLLKRLEEAARQNGIARMRADFLAENDSARALIAAAGFDPPVYDQGVASVERDLAT